MQRSQIQNILKYKKTIACASLAFSAPLIALSLMSCSGEDTFPTATKKTTTVGGETGGTGTLPKDTFYANVKSTPGSLRYIHKNEDWTQGCYVDLEEAEYSNRQISCVVETTELDLMSIGLELAYEIPQSDNCSYMKQTSTYYYNWPIIDDGTGLTAPIGVSWEPTEVKYYVNAATGGLIESGTFNVGGVPTDLSYSVTIDGTKYTGTNASARVPIINSTPTCYYNYTDRVDSSAPNCCEDNYTLTKCTYDASATPEVTCDAASSTSWGGKKSSCLAGPAFENQDLSNKGVPIPKMYRLEYQNLTAQSMNKSSRWIKMTPAEIEEFMTAPKGKKLTSSPQKQSSSPINILEFSSWKIGPNLSNSRKNTFYASNWIDSSMTVPKAFTDSGQDTRATVWSCYDDAREQYASISLYVREWNQYSDLYEAFTNKTEPGTGPTGADDIKGNETGSGEPINDFPDWEDLKIDNNSEYPKELPEA